MPMSHPLGFSMMMSRVRLSKNAETRDDGFVFFFQRGTQEQFKKNPTPHTPRPPLQLLLPIQSAKCTSSTKQQVLLYSPGFWSDNSSTGRGGHRGTFTSSPIGTRGRAHTKSLLFPREPLSLENLPSPFAQPRRRYHPDRPAAPWCQACRAHTPYPAFISPTPIALG